jgi:hypothetical protein
VNPTGGFEKKFLVVVGMNSDTQREMRPARETDAEEDRLPGHLFQ